MEARISRSLGCGGFVPEVPVVDAEAIVDMLSSFETAASKLLLDEIQLLERLVITSSSWSRRVTARHGAAPVLARLENAESCVL